MSPKQLPMQESMLARLLGLEATMAARLSSSMVARLQLLLKPVSKELTHLMLSKALPPRTLAEDLTSAALNFLLQLFLMAPSCHLSPQQLQMLESLRARFLGLEVTMDAR